MSEHDEQLQERIAQYENGESLEACLLGLPAQDADALHLIASMQTMPIADAAADSIAAQRANVLQAATVRLNGANEGMAATAVPFWVQLQMWFTQLFARREVRFGLAALLIILFIGFYWKGMTFVRVAEETGDVVAVSNGAEDEVVSETETAEIAVVADPPAAQGPTIFLPVVSMPVMMSADTAVIQGIKGIVEVQRADGWQTVGNNVSLAAGQRIRTGDLSQATLSFYDGSEAYLSANTEMTIDELNALRPEEGFRTVVMTQWIGNSEHSVAFRNDGGSRYEVKTPDGSGLARGTKFNVLVAPNMLTRYIVTEGKVDVSAQNQVVPVTAGQLSTILTGSTPAEANFNISGEGEVTALGSEWTIAGQTFQTYEQTIIVGNPQLGDLVQVNGHLLPDGSRVADTIVLLRRAIVDRFNIEGDVASTGAMWVVAGQSIMVDAETEVDDDIVVGDTVRVEGIILTGGALQATEITKVDDVPGLPFQFTGIVQTIGDESWMISGQTIAVDGDTAVSEEIEAGDVVAVKGWILEDGNWLATAIEEQEDDDLPTFEFTGSVQNMNPWQVAGIDFETRAWTVVATDLALGDSVRVRGTILSDGTWVADAIIALDDLSPDTITFVGVVVSMEPWVINGMPLVVSSETLIDDSVTVGAQVVVQAQLLPDGTWSILTIQTLYPNFGYGCLTLISPITVVNADSFELKHWKVQIKRDGRIKINGNLKVSSITTLPICSGWDGITIIIGDIIVIYQPIVIIINNGGGNPLPPDCRITPKGNVKCSGKGSGKDS